MTTGGPLATTDRTATYSVATRSGRERAVTVTRPASPTIQTAYRDHFPVMARLLAALPADATDREQIAANVALTIAAQKTRAHGWGIAPVIPEGDPA